MKPPKVSRAQLAARGFDYRHGSTVRVPEGLLPNALPNLWLAAPVDGRLLIMADKSRNVDGATGPQVCLATISPETLQLLLASKSPVELTL